MGRRRPCLASIRGWMLGRVERRRGEVQGRGSVVVSCIDFDANFIESPSIGRCGWRAAESRQFGSGLVGVGKVFSCAYDVLYLF